MKLATLLTSALLLSACALEADDSTCTTERKIATNKLATNKLATNKLATNKLAVNGLLSTRLPGVPLTSEGIADAVPADALADAFVQEVLEYMVGCALAPDQSLALEIAGERHVYTGALGLAPQWSAGSCDSECQGWVSACLIARTNAHGESVPISLLGDHPALAPTVEESAAFALEEATYFGDLFGADRTLYACVPDGADAPERTCDGDATGCAIAVLGECDEVCDDNGCRDPNGIVHGQTITVNLSPDAGPC